MGSKHCCQMRSVEYTCTLSKKSDVSLTMAMLRLLLHPGQSLAKYTDYLFVLSYVIEILNRLTLKFLTVWAITDHNMFVHSKSVLSLCKLVEAHIVQIATHSYQAICFNRVSLPQLPASSQFPCCRDRSLKPVSVSTHSAAFFCSCTSTVGISAIGSGCIAVGSLETDLWLVRGNFRTGWFVWCSSITALYR